MSVGPFVEFLFKHLYYQSLFTSTYIECLFKSGSFYFVPFLVLSLASRKDAIFDSNATWFE